MKNLVFTVISLILTLGAVAAPPKKNTTFTVVIDAGHGGKDPGAVGRISKEKDINLSVALQVGELIAAKDSSVKVIFTRKTDVYLTLQERAAIANNAQADLFISIHVNASTNREAFGSETFTLGLAKSSSNLDVAMRENSVILLEDGYKEKYAGFDPKSVDSYIMFELNQDLFLHKSIEIASDVQANFVGVGRKDRGVMQAGFLVLYQTVMPAILVELGFISNIEEEKYLNTEKGRRDLSQAISKAFENFKKEHEKKNAKQGETPVIAEQKKENDEVKKPKDTPKYTPKPAPTTTAPPQTTPAANTPKPAPKPVPATSISKDETVYKLQIFALKRKLPAGDPALKGLKADFYEEGGWIKYTYGSSTSLEEIKKIKTQIAGKFPDAMIIGFKNGVKIKL